MRKTLSVAAMILVSVCLLWPGIAGAETRSFEDPTFGRARLDFCRFNQDGCGIEAALHFCRREGYVDAQSYRGPVSVTRTMRVGNRTTCRGRRCQGFSQIICERPDPVVDEEEWENTGYPHTGFPYTPQAVEPDTNPLATPFPTIPEPEPSGTFTYRPQPNPTGPNTSIFTNIVGPTIDGCEAGHPGPRDYECSTIASYHICQGHMRDGTAHDCLAEVSSPGSLIQFDQQHPNSYQLNTSSNIQVAVDRSNRNGGEAQGNAQWNIVFTAPAEYPNPGCNPNAPIVSAGDCMRRCETKNRYTYNRDGVAGGIFAIAGLDNCNSAITAQRSPDEFDLLRSWDICQAEDAWGGNAHGQLRYRIAALYHMSDPHTSQNGNGWSYENEADVIAPYVNVTAPITIFCVDN